MEERLIARNRFGLGGRGNQTPLADPRRWLLNQLDRFDTRPAPIAERRSSKDALADLIEYREYQRMMRQERQRNTPSNDMSSADMNPDDPADSADEAVQAVPEKTRRMRRAIRQEYAGDVVARGLTAIRSETPFMERMVHFWSNHFAVSIRKPQVMGLVGPYEFEAIRPNLLGSFRDLLRASVLNPAMLVYLDQAQSIGPESLAGKRARNRGNRELGLNENLAREIFELHTLGVRSGYSQTDVTEFARALTGWTVSGLRQTRRATPLPNGSAFAAYLHEPGKRKILGSSYADTSGQQALSVLDDLAKHPATATHIATKLARHFAGDEPPPSMIVRLENAFLGSDGDLPTLYRAIVESPEAWTPAPVKFRQPWEWSIAALRAGGARNLGARGFIGLLNELGQPAWAPTSPAGYDDTVASWAAPDALIRRVEAAERLATLYPGTDVSALAVSLYGEGLNDTTRAAIRRAESAKQGMALLLSSPEMMRR